MSSLSSSSLSRIQLVHQHHQLLVQNKEQLIQEKQRQQQLVASISATATAITTSKMSSSTSSSSSSSVSQKDLLHQQQQKMRAKSIEKELERNKRQRQIEKVNPTPESIADKKNIKVCLALGHGNPAFIQHVLNQPENVDKCLDEVETSVHELLYKDPIDYIGEHLWEAYRYKTILKSDDEYIKLYGVDVDELKKQRKEAFLASDNGNNNDEAVCNAVIKSSFAYVNAIESNDESWTIFKEKKKCSMTISQQAQIIEQEQELQEVSKSITIIKKKNNNVFNELITYYNGGSDLRQQKTNEYFS